MKKEAPDYTNPKDEELRQAALKSHKGKPPEGQKGDNYDDENRDSDTDD